MLMAEPHCLLFVSPGSRRIPAFGMFFQIRSFIAADGTLDRQGQTRFPAAKSQRWTSSLTWTGASPPPSFSLPAPIFARRKVLRGFSGAEIVSGEAGEAGRPSPGNEENEAGRGFRPEKPCLPLPIEGIAAFTAVHTGSRPHQSRVKQLRRR